MRGWVAPFDPPLFTESQRDYLRQVRVAIEDAGTTAGPSLFDPDLGWCSPATAAVPGANAVRVVAVGGSFTRGAEVESHESWVGLLDARAGIEITNLGVNGYGIDQALLRLRRDGPPQEPDEIWLGLMPSAIERLTTQFPPISRHWSSVAAFKPRFLLNDEAELELAPSPVRSLADYDRLLSDQAALVEAIGGTDYWMRRCSAAYVPRGRSWTHWFATTRLALTWMESSGRDDAGFLARDHPVRALTLALLDEYEREARSLGARLRVVVIPARSDLRHAREQGSRYWANLVQALASRGVAVLDCTDALERAGAVEGDDYWMPGNHYSPAANRVVAEAVAASWLEDEG